MLNFEIEGDDEMRDRLLALPQKVQAQLALKARNLAERLAAKTRDDKLSGQVLAARSGALRAAVASEVAVNAGTIEAQVFIRDLPYAAAQEFGFDGAESVRAFSRRIKQAFGRAIAPKDIFVRAFIREMRLPARHFLSSALEEARDDIVQSLVQTVREELRG